MRQTVDKKLFSPRRGRIAFSANERIAEFLDFAIQAKFAYVNKLTRDARTALGKEENSVEKRRINRFCEAAALAAFVLLTAALALPVTILGGALYHLLFEAKAQYAYPYMVYMLPLAAAGLCALAEKLKKISG